MRSPIVACFVLAFGASFTLAQYSSPQLHNGTTFVASVDHAIRASHAKPGDQVDLRVAQPFLLNGEVIPQGAKIKGHVVVARRVDKKAKLDSLLAIVADEISWKKKSVAVRAWIVGFGSVRVSTGNGKEKLRMDQRVRAIMSETTDRPASTLGRGRRGPELFGASAPIATSTTYDPSAFVQDLRIARNPASNIGTLLVHDDGDVYLPKSLLILMEQIEVSDPSSEASPTERPASPSIGIPLPQ